MTTPPVRRVFYSATVITLTAGNTNSYGEPCEPGRGYTEQHGYWSPDHDYWSLHSSPEHVQPDLYPDDTGIRPGRWLADQVVNRLGNIDHIDGHTFVGARTAIEPGQLTGAKADAPGNVAGAHALFGDVFAAERIRTAEAGTRLLTATAHAYGFTPVELTEAAHLLSPQA